MFFTYFWVCGKFNPLGSDVLSNSIFAKITPKKEGFHRNLNSYVKAELSKPSRAMGSAPDQVAINARRDAVDGEEMEVIHWLQEIEENDPEIYRDVLLAMRTNPTHRAGFLKMARGDAGGNA